ncbi:hypothetical protein PLA107_033320 (plasmid) [Pseudomonas amygdali pv. lachrymans str. M301315]|uniref:Uncharacterized protein n=1 Tax=Pseudomonas amygdali pv. lachrymans str. M301315 TaxID=629260 RepID=A0AAD0PWK1_PSEAV|nr:hypothetical protein PLA107_033320 [Pseudomonas amygdali pv. lachrymans str. M301315]
MGIIFLLVQASVTASLPKASRQSFAHKKAGEGPALLCPKTSAIFLGIILTLFSVIWVAVTAAHPPGGLLLGLVILDGLLMIERFSLATHGESSSGKVE